MGRGMSYPLGLRERAIRAVAEVRPGNPRRTGGKRPGMTSDESAELHKIRTEVPELLRT